MRSETVDNYQLILEIKEVKKTIKIVIFENIIEWVREREKFTVGHQIETAF